MVCNCISESKMLHCNYAKSFFTYLDVVNQKSKKSNSITKIAIKTEKLFVYSEKIFKIDLIMNYSGHLYKYLYLFLLVSAKCHKASLLSRNPLV